MTFGAVVEQKSASWSTGESAAPKTMRYGGSSPVLPPFPTPPPPVCTSPEDAIVIVCSNLLVHLVDFIEIDDRTHTHMEQKSASRSTGESAAPTTMHDCGSSPVLPLLPTPPPVCTSGRMRHVRSLVAV
ncbi:unnamed protein product [Dibothriocephalus latus]|uniref:Uncharacterized protein n=1 Tax=Dibothriocephalus latus TaxID=60516 RepID=A0A3P7QAX3_DIBLA|nr:unnamed protein product [Dibothriocephalus latus]